MKFRRILRVIALCACLVGASELKAQPLFSRATSIESLVARSDAVFLGRITHRGQSSTGQAKWTIRVEETLKGKHLELRSVHLPETEATTATWKEDSHRLLIAVIDGSPQQTTVIDLAADSLEILTQEFEVLRTPAEVIRAAKETAGHLPDAQRIPSFGIVVPVEAVAGTRWETYYRSGGHVTLAVPISRYLEERAREDIRSESYSRRLQGARALRFFETDENISQVKSLLDDPGWAYQRHAQYNLGIEVRHYGVRQAAYETLKHWGIHVEQPQVREELAKPELVTLVHLSNQPVKKGQLKDLARFENLEILIVCDTPISDESLKELVELKNLKELYLAGTKVTDAGVRRLADLKNLRYLNVAHTAVTDECIVELKKQLPKLKVER